MPSTLVINDGSLAALVACAAERDRGVDVVAWVPPGGSGLTEPGFGCDDALALARRQGKLLGYRAVLDHAPALGEGGAGTHHATGIGTTMLLLEAARCAMANACGRVVWPVAVGEDPGAMAWADERTELVNRLLALDEESGVGAAIEVVAPWVDLSPSQIEDLASDLAVPRHLARTSARAGGGG